MAPCFCNLLYFKFCSFSFTDYIKKTIAKIDISFLLLNRKQFAIFFFFFFMKRKKKKQSTTTKRENCEKIKPNIFFFLNYQISRLKKRDFGKTATITSKKTTWKCKQIFPHYHIKDFKFRKFFEIMKNNFKKTHYNNNSLFNCVCPYRSTYWSLQ